MSNVKPLTTLAVLLSLGILATACKPPLPPDQQPAAIEARRQAEEEAKKKAEEDAKKKAEEDAKKAEEDAKKKAEDDARRRAEEEARRRAEEALTVLRNAAALALVDINFDYNQSDIRRADRAKFQAIAEFMKAFPEASVRIEGHCDERGTVEYNMTLGEKRAQAAKSYLVGLGINDARFSTISFGKELPKYPGHDEKSWFGNRRCEFKLQQ